jgi:hypothetical protein
MKPEGEQVTIETDRCITEKQDQTVVGSVVCRARPILSMFQDLQRDCTVVPGREACKQPKEGVRFAATEYRIRHFSIHSHLAAFCVSSSPRHGLLFTCWLIDRPTEVRCCVSTVFPKAVCVG